VIGRRIRDSTPPDGVAVVKRILCSAGSSRHADIPQGS
jgi:hypothetical protein